MTPERHRTILGRVSRFESVEVFRSLDPDDWPKLSIAACRLAIAAAGVDDQEALAALRAVELDEVEPEIATSMRDLADQRDEEAWAAREAGDGESYDRLFRHSRAVSALAYALSGEPDEAIYEAAYAVGTPEELAGRLTS